MKNINKIVSFVILLIVGWIFNFLSGNIIITTVGCLLLGVVLNRKSRPPTKAEAKTAREGEPLRCQRCGTMVGSGENYCRECGTRTAQPSLRASVIPERYYPKQVEEWLREIAAKDNTSYLYILYDVLLIDERGDYWSIDAESSRWCRYKEGGWISDEPIGTLQLTRRNDVSPEVSIPTIDAEKGEAPANSICSFCNAEIGASDQFCINCGRNLTVKVD